MFARSVLVRRAIRHKPLVVPLGSLPPSLLVHRHITISSPGSGSTPERANPNNTTSPASSSNSNTLNDNGTGPYRNGNNEHMGIPVSAFSSSSSSFQDLFSNPDSSSSSSSFSFTPPPDPKQATISVTSLPSPPESSRPPHVKHPFDTHAFVAYLEKSGLNEETSRTMMEVVRELIIQRSNRARENMSSKEDMDNDSYLFRAALSELRTELSVRARNDGIALRAMSSAIQREVDGLEQKMKEDIQTLKHDIEIDMNNRKSETRSEMKAFDMAIEEINNKFTISLGDLRTETERAKWDATRRAISIIALLVIVGVGFSTFAFTDVTPPPTAYSSHKEPAKSNTRNLSTSHTTSAPTSSSSSSYSSMSSSSHDGNHHHDTHDPPPMKDVAVGTEDEADFGITEARLEKLLSEIEMERTKPPKTERRESRGSGLGLGKSFDERI